MGKRKKPTRGKPGGAKKKSALPTQFQCLFCNHETSVTVKMDRKGGIGTLKCKVCGQSYQTSIHTLSEGVDVYSDWIDACEAVANDNAAATVSTARDTQRPDPKNRLGIAARNDQYEDDFVVNDEAGMEEDFGED